MKTKELLIEKRGEALWLTLNRPDSMNALSPALVLELDEAMKAARFDRSVRCVVITGAGSTFCAGADLSFALDAVAAGAFEDFLEFLDAVGKAFERLRDFPKPVVAALNGITLAGGLELAMCCDLVYAAESARIGDAHANYGLLPGAGGAVRLPRLIGPARAKKLMFTGEMIPAQELVAAGLINAVARDEELEAVVRKTVDAIAMKSPLALRRMKELANGASDQPIELALRAEFMALTGHLHSEDMAEGLRAFREKRKPHFVGR